jgi:flagellar motor switch protein FliG
VSKSILIPTLLLIALAGPSRSAPGRSDGREVDREYERIAHEALSRYFDDGTFLVRASAELLEEDFPSVDRDNHMALPGLPATRGATPQPSAHDMVASVQLDILVDTAYTARDRDFIEYLVSLAADLDTSRGDEILVRRAVFPRDNRAVGPHRKSESWSDPASPKAPTPPDTAPAALPAPPPPPDLAAQVTERLVALLPLLVVCFTALLCAWLLGRAIFSSRGSSDETEERILKRLSSWRRKLRADEAPRPAIALPEPRPAPAPSQSPAPSPSSAPSPSDPTLRHSLLDAIVGDPRLSGQVLRHWILRDPRKGAQQVASLLSGVDANLLGMLRDALGADASRAVESILSSDEPIVQEDVAGAAHAFLRDFRKASSKQAETQDSDLFGFLDQLNEAQIAFVLKGESAGVAGFALTQISPDKTSSILSKLDPATRARLLVGMGNVSQIPRDVYREMADRLSLKALEASKIQYVAADGVDSILKLIDALPIDEQFGYIHSISEIDIQLARRLRERTITFSELGTLPDRFLAPRLQSMDPDLLALALLRAEPDLRSHLLSLLPERQQMMLNSTMDSRRQSTRDEIDAAARKVLKIVRDEIRRQGRPQ